MIVIKEIIIKENYAAISKLMLGLHDSEREFFSKGSKWADIEKHYMQHVIDMQEEHDGTCLIAQDDEDVIGFIFGYSYEDEDSRTEDYIGEELYISDGFVEATYRRQGIYKLLNDTLEKKYIEQGVRRIVRYTLSSNERMRKFLDKNEYTVVRLQYEKWLSPNGENAEPLGLKSNL